MSELRVPAALDGWCILHRMFRFDRLRWDACAPEDRLRTTQRAQTFIEGISADEQRDLALVGVLGGKADLMLVAYARSFDDLAMIEVAFDKLELRAFLSPGDSYVSILEMGLYEATARIDAALRERGLEPDSAEWRAAFAAALETEAKAPFIAPRLWARIPRRRYVCFYPMNKLRGESQNWYTLPYEERARQMRDHGLIGRKYAGAVTQVISGSIGFDDWEWGVDLYADDPLTFKRLVYEMRFDEASAKYGVFGPFVTGMQFSPAQLAVWLDGSASPQLLEEQSGLPASKPVAS